MKLVAKIRQHGILGSARKAIAMVDRTARTRYYRWAARNAPQYSNPTTAELEHIEEDLLALGVAIHDYTPRAEDFAAFRAADYFPLDYHGGIDGSVWDEKLLEHWIAAERLGLRNYQPADTYVDVAAGTSPWAKALRDRFGISAYAIDLGEVDAAYKDLPFYRREDATATSFSDASVSGVSLQCAYEMFMRDDDTNLLRELARILKPGGKAVLVPLYMHTHYCAYATAEYYGKGHADGSAKEYVCRDWDGIPSARFYDARELVKRVLAPIESLGMRYRLLALRNKADFGKDIYCHFILEFTR